MLWSCQKCNVMAVACKLIVIEPLSGGIAMCLDCLKC